MAVGCFLRCLTASAQEKTLAWVASQPILAQMHMHISPVFILLGFLAGGECTLML